MTDNVVDSSAPGDGLPLVANRRPSNAGLYAFIAVLVLGGVALFSALNANRLSQSAPATTVDSGIGSQRITSPQALALPRAFRDDQRRNAPAQQSDASALTEPRTIERAPLPPNAFATVPPREAPPLVQVQRASETDDGPEIVYGSQQQRPALLPRRDDRESPARITADRFQNPSYTIPQGTLIPAVLETALDSTRPGAARALVQRDIYSFDGTRVLIQRGSRLYGEYEGGIEQGQKRAGVQWTRLIRPDGVTIALDSPASDPLGGAGVKGKVDSKFLQRFGGSLLQSVLDIGVGLAVGEATDGVIIALPGSRPNVQIQPQQQIQPTLKVKHGSRISVFVARDLDFSSVEQ